MVKILGAYLKWHYSDRVKAILEGWKGFLKFNLYYFSIPLLLKTLFSPWRKYKWSYGNPFDFKLNAEALLSNLISRILGAIVRSFLILAGAAAELAIVLLGLVVLFCWLTLPLLMLAIFVFSLDLIF